MKKAEIVLSSNFYRGSYYLAHDIPVCMDNCNVF